MAGEDDFLIKLHVAAVERLQRIVNEFRRHPRVTATRTLVVLRSWTSGRPLGLST